MKNYVQAGSIVTLIPAVAVASGVGYLAGAALFGVATGDVAANEEGEFKTDGVVDIAKTSALAVSVGDRLFWDAANKCVNKTAAAQLCVGVAIAAAANGAATVAMKLGTYAAPAA
ncbi:DUF2190 family protein [Comamonas thiooxydans]|uniref:DUF2190 family protein n=1 Tax=Comamonas thiooxydans TaxID=363952 RepID=A0A0E3BJ02_9BURK|nr:DUF2190 family protein [Comamonas thiooxydans]KGG90704.1 hypothetical protein P245_15535 [Comamonas thiooxydans]